MIGSLRGEVLERWADGIVLVDVGGVGYEVTVSSRAVGELEPTTQAFLYVHHHIREDGQTLYGFLSREERMTFKTLIATHGVGPAMAMAILNTYAPAALIDVVANGDKGALTAIPGVGPKTAERMLVELRDRLAVPVLDTDTTSAANGSSAVGAVREALAGLGYGPDEIRDAVRKLDTADGDAATLLRDALKLLGAKRA